MSANLVKIISQKWKTKKSESLHSGNHLIVFQRENKSFPFLNENF